ncbi:NAD-dependent epimerase/dehydratase family protein [Streptomyces sp. 3MP-14]|uniref:NAD-dependent epimerase/dehydratase family protein n=1 Tax=Streptomyces mimosae TaxID=2586635 RepID=A0A5N6AFT0_9ACTN|nr:MULTISPECIES: UDP-glucuronic acid decarboxylase family protein [Streptomyces]KAB8166418.1 NAD-dependent epimerase/dehydratase family protein [Streptomyces mimosae]KAB8174211.1 NAD-dependent epimerase/dehydratase family protein [Streptomyces sp. 3MP-14]
MPESYGELLKKAVCSRLRRVLVAGGAGFIGSHLCDALLRDGVEVICVDNLSTGSYANISHLQHDSRFSLVIQDAEHELKTEKDLDAVFHVASPASPEDYMRLPIETLRAGSHVTLNLISLARANGARFLLASTSEVYGDPLEHPQPESYWGHVNPIGPRSVYDEAKRFAEALTMAYRTTHGVDTAIVRIFNTYGPRMRVNDGRAIPNFIAQALAGEDVTVAGNGRQTRSFCYIDDMVTGILAAAVSKHSGPINLGNPDERSIVDLARTVIDMCNSPSSMKFVERPTDDPTQRKPDISLAGEILGWCPSVSLETGLAYTIAWFQATARQLD